MNRTNYSHGRQLRPEREPVEMSYTSDGIDALLELLVKADHHVVLATTLPMPLKPIHENLTDASRYLNHMRLYVTKKKPGARPGSTSLDARSGWEAGAITKN